jgi:hypothetical protein
MKFHYLVGASSSIWSFGLYRVSWEQQAGNDVDGKGGWARRSCVVGTHRRIGNPPPGVPPFFHESKGKVCTRNIKLERKILGRNSQRQLRGPKVSAYLAMTHTTELFGSSASSECCRTSVGWGMPRSLRADNCCRAMMDRRQTTSCPTYRNLNKTDGKR